MSLIDLSATEQLGQLEAGEVTSVELVNAHLAQIDQYDERVGAFLNVDRDGALQRAEQIDASRRRGERLGRLAGLPVAVKDVVCTKGQPTTCASRMLEHFVPPYDATVVAHLKRAGAVQLGKTNMDEFAMGGSTENSAYHVTRNPWDLARTPGGSSGGAAACVAARMAPLSVGSDTGGSIRQPAGLCGAVGMKPTYGRVSRYGLVAFASSLDQIGPLARTAQDCALLLEVLAGYDANDSTSVDRPVPQYRETLTQPVRGLKLGLVREHFENGSNGGLDGDVEAAVREAVRAFESLGATVHDVSLPHSKYAVATYYVIAPSEASSNLARYDGVHFGYRTDRSSLMTERDRGREQGGESGGPARTDESGSGLVQMVRRTRSEGFGAEVQRRIMLGTYALSAGYYDAYYLKALKARRLIRQDYDEAFGEVDLIIGPVTAAPAFPLGQWTDDPLAMYLVDLFTVGANLAGIPGICIPCGQSRNGLPIGLQLLAPPFQEERLLQAAHAFQQATDWHARKPELISS